MSSSASTPPVILRPSDQSGGMGTDLVGMPVIQTAIRYTQVSREHVKEKLKLLQG